LPSFSSPINVADIHELLHVGAQYFDGQGRIADPDRDRSALADEGGNTFALELSDEPPRTRGVRKKKFHAFWDYDAVNALFPQVPVRGRKRELQAQIAPLKKQLVRELAAREPKSWRMPANKDVTNYAEVWANEILPIAREAHERLEFTNVHPKQEQNRVLAAGEAVENPGLGRFRIAYGRQLSSAKNYTKPAGGWQIYLRRR
jgi:hypothetical protein